MSVITNMKWTIFTLCTFALFSSCKKESIGPVPSDWFYTQRAFPKGIDYKAHLSALKTYNHNQTLKNKHANPWVQKGPSNVGGRVTDIEMFSDDQNTILVGSASGGIFRSLDRGQSYSPIFDEAMSLSIGDIEIAKSNENTVYVGTGEANAGGGSLAYDGVGVYKSLDRGQTWNHIGLSDVGSIGKVAVDPTDQNKVFVASMGRLFANNAERGIYRTLDGGENWDQVLSVSDSTGGIDLAIHPEDTDIVYAAMWERRRKLNNLHYGGPTSGIYKSTDGGDTWTDITDNIPTNITLGRIGLAIAPSNPDKIYAYVARASGGILSVYTSYDGGDSWSRMGNQGIDATSFMWWFGKITVSPVDANEVYVTSLHANKSSNGGSFWTRIFRGAHVDQHSIFIHPQNPDLIVAGNDGGVYVSEDKGGTYIKSPNLPNMQFYAIEINNQQPHILAGGTQDNGTQMTRDGENDNWEFILGGDGFRVVIHPENDNIMYAESQYGAIARSTNGGQSFAGATSGFFGTKNWDTPITNDPSNPNFMYTGSQFVFRSFNGNRWTDISPDLTNGPYSGNRNFGTITSISVSPLSRDIIYAGTDDGNIHIGEGSGRIFLGRKQYEWTKISDSLPVRWVTSVAASPHDINTVYVTLSGYRYDDATAQVFMSEDKGETWSDIGASLPDIPVNDIIIHPSKVGTLYVATDAGVYVSEDNGDTWNILGQGLPIVPVTDIDYHQGDDFLIAATYGRSAYRYNFPPIAIPDETTSNNKLAAKVLPNPSSDYIQLDHGLDGTQLTYKITDGNGTVVMQGEYTGRINIANLHTQKYYLMVSNAERSVISSFIKL